MKKLIISLFFAVLTTTFIQAQVSYELRESLDLFRTTKIISGDWREALTANEIEGSPFLNDEFIVGNVYTTAKQKYADIPLRYNIFNDQLEFKTPDEQIQTMASPETIEKVEIGNDVLVYVPYINVKKVRKGFFMVIEEGKVSLFERKETVFKKAEEAGAYKEPEPAKFVTKADTYYIQTEGSPAKLVGKKKDIIELFPDHSNEISAFIKKNKTKTNKVESLRQLVQYYNSL